MNAQDMVTRCFPDAEAREQPAIFERGGYSPLEHSFWAIFAGPGRGSDELGRGRSEAEAWSDAAGLRGNQAGLRSFGSVSQAVGSHAVRVAHCGCPGTISRPSALLNWIVSATSEQTMVWRRLPGVDRAFARVSQRG